MTVERVRVERARSWASAAVAVVAVVMMSAATSWACSPSASVSGIYPDAGGSRSEATVTGKYMTPVVEIRWGAVTGPLLAKVSGPSFSARVQIPEADPGYYYVVALGRAADGSIAGKASTTFQVTGPEPGTDTAPTSPAPADAAPAGPAQTSTGSSASPDPTAATSAAATAPTSQSQPNAQPVASPLPSPAASSPARPVAANGASDSNLSSTVAATVAPRTNTASVAQTPTATATLPVYPTQSSAGSTAPVDSGPAVNPEPVLSQVAPIEPAWQDAPVDGHLGLLNVDGVRSARAPAAGFAAALTLGAAALFGGFGFVAVIRRRQLARSTSR